MRPKCIEPWALDCLNRVQSLSMRSFFSDNLLHTYVICKQKMVQVVYQAVTLSQPVYRCTLCFWVRYKRMHSLLVYCALQKYKINSPYVCVAWCVSHCVCQYVHAFPGKKKKTNKKNPKKTRQCLPAEWFPPVWMSSFFPSSCLRSCRHMGTETAGNSGLFNFLTFRQDWICSAAKPEKSPLQAKSQLRTWPSCSRRHGEREREQ